MGSKNTPSQSVLFVLPGVLELFAVSQGVIGIKGVYSNRFLAMNDRGRLHATVSIPSVSHPALLRALGSDKVQADTRYNCKE